MALLGKIVIVTGGGNGIGRELSELLAKEGAKLSVCDIDEAAGSSLVNELNNAHGKGTALFTKCDVSDEGSFREVFINTKMRFGRIDIVVNNAGILDDSAKGWQKCVDTNFKGVVAGSRLAIEFMGMKNGGDGGLVLNVSSVAGVQKAPCWPVYSASKAAIILFTLNMSSDLHFKKSSVRFIAVCPYPAWGSNMSNSDSSHFFYDDDDELINDMLTYSETADIQHVEHVAKRMVSILKNGRNGTTWAIKNNRAEFEINVFPDFLEGIRTSKL